MRLAVRHLAELGRRRIGFINGPLDTTPGQVRGRAFLAACRQAGVSTSARHRVVANDFTFEAGAQAARALLDRAGEELDAVLAAGIPYGLRPFGEEALLMARIEAGLVLINVEFSSSRFAFTDQQRVTPLELGFGWMLRGIDADDRPFIGRNAIRREIAGQTSRWSTVGLLLDWADWNRLYTEAGLIPPKDETPLGYESMLYHHPDGAAGPGGRVGYATSLMYSPILQRHIAIARVRPDLAAVGTRLQLELTIDHEYRTVAADVAKLPLFNPERKTA
jgi:aminomethyltransferase